MGNHKMYIYIEREVTQKKNKKESKHLNKKINKAQKKKAKVKKNKRPKRKRINKMEIVNFSQLVITLNINGLNSSMKWHTMAL